MTCPERGPASLIPARGPAHYSLAGGLILIFLVLLIGSLRTTSVTTDEFGHLPAGLAYLRTGQPAWLALNPPLQTVWAAAPLWLDPAAKLDLSTLDQADFWDLGREFLVQNREHYQALFMRARIMVSILALAAALLTYALARLAAGPRAGLLALTLFAFSPEFLAHGGLVTADLAAALAGLATVTAILFHRRRPSLPRLALVCLAVPLLLLAKFSALIFLPLVPILLLAPIPDAEAGTEPVLRRPLRVAAELMAIGLACWLVVAAAYGFAGMFVRLNGFTFDSRLLAGLKLHFGWLPVPLPRAFLIAFDRQLYEHRSSWPVYAFGRIGYGRPLWYYPVCFLFKWPLALMALLALGLAQLGRGRLRLAGWTLGPGLWFLLLIALSPAKLIGVRLVLPTLAFVLVFTAAILARPWCRPAAGNALTWARRAAAMLLVWYAADTVYAYPHYLAYFNELAGGPRPPHRGAQYLADSNLDWGQDLIRLAQWQQRTGIDDLWLDTSGLVDPSVYGVHFRFSQCQPHPGYHAVGLNLRFGLDVFEGRDECYTTYVNLTPIDHIGGSILIYKLP
jgi:hypothetical protein